MMNGLLAWWMLRHQEDNGSTHNTHLVTLTKKRKIILNVLVLIVGTALFLSMLGFIPLFVVALCMLLSFMATLWILLV